MSITFSPAMRPASIVALRRVSSKYAGTVITQPLIGPSCAAASCGELLQNDGRERFRAEIAAGDRPAVVRLSHAPLDERGDAIRLFQRHVQRRLADDGGAVRGEVNGGWRQDVAVAVGDRVRAGRGRRATRRRVCGAEIDADQRHGCRATRMGNGNSRHFNSTATQRGMRVKRREYARGVQGAGDGSELSSCPIRSAPRTSSPHGGRSTRSGGWEGNAVMDLVLSFPVKGSAPSPDAAPLARLASTSPPNSLGERWAFAIKETYAKEPCATSPPPWWGNPPRVPPVPPPVVVGERSTPDAKAQRSGAAAGEGATCFHPETQGSKPLSICMASLKTHTKNP